PAYSNSFETATATFAGRVQGVVVQMRRYSPGFPVRGNLTKTEGSFSSQYSTSASAIAVSHRGHQFTTRWPRSSIPRSSALARVHQAASIYSGFTVWYAPGKSIQTPRAANWSSISFLLSTAN